MIRNAHIIPLAATAIALFACSPASKKEEARIEPPKEEIIISVQEEVAESEPTPQAETPKIALDPGVLEEIPLGPYDNTALGEMLIDASSPESIKKSLEAIGKEIQKLTPEEQKKIQEAAARYFVDFIREIPDFQTRMAEHSRLPQPERKAAEENFMMQMVAPLNGKTFADFMYDAEIRAEGRPNPADELRALFTPNMN